MPTVECTATGWRTNRRFRRGYRLRDDQCQCGAALKRVKGASRDPYPHHLCPHHDCYQAKVLGTSIDFRQHVFQFSSGGTGRDTVYGYADIRTYRCPRCNGTWEISENPTMTKERTS
jgi:hypothetical protein